ncbi:alpha-amylase family protein [Paenibacillus rigui]|uniref:Glycoside hydrolase n=1 Tax=Paenibacillus rigui TaxID=554312 RepID=A0A229UMC9_9BACL|nr:alpha-amylase family protein [Paenibacillus rigui]OXM84474.1 glycoside hydrolase [Paenibacillus rigui]
MQRTVLFYDPSFPYVGERPNEGALQQLRQQYTVTDAAGLAEALADAPAYVHLHGPYFPKAAWQAVLNHIRSGKGLLSAGGAPFRTPVVRRDGQWAAEPDQTGYLQQLHIHEALPVDPAPIARLAAHREIPLFAGKEGLFTIEPTFGVVLHVTKTDDQPGQLGSSGPMDAHIYPLLKGISGCGLEREVAAPAILLEHTKGPFTGGRWIFINQVLGSRFWQNGGAAALAEWADFTAAGVTEFWLKPNYASYEPGDRATLTLQGQRLGAERDQALEWTYQVALYKAVQTEVQEAIPGDFHQPGRYERLWEGEFQASVGRELQFTRMRLPVELEAGFYFVECAARAASGERRILQQGFWGHDAELLQKGEMLSCDRDYFRKNGKPLPIVGMTYMTSDVARKFLNLPNVSVWDRDMAQMKRAGINMIRTGIWTAWRQLMFIDGHAVEETMRAIDAFLLTAKRYDLEVTFNFFAFTPELWEGVNPYLDPRSVEAQKRFIASVVSRHAETAHVHWDLINEPSMFDPKRIFSGPRSAQDRFEKEAFVAWLAERHGSIVKLQERWNMTPEELPSFEAAKLPEPEDLNFNTTINVPKKSGPLLDYTLFTMEMHNRWGAQLIETIRSIQPKQLVTVGQDEGLGGQRPSPFFYAEEVDYTTVHSWWKMDDLVWDGVFTKDTLKPNLIQETGIMYIETPDGRAKRSEAELRNILERKYAYAFSTGGAGAVQWIWNINFYMNNVNESNIGALRADGTEKPEASVSYDFGAFMAEIGHLFEGRELEEVAVVFPYSNDFSTRKLAYEGTTRAIRTLSYEMNVHARGLGEYHLESLEAYPPKLIIVPSPHNFSDEALERLTAHVKRHGGTLLFTGPIGLDAYWRPAERLTAELGAGAVVNVLREEALELNGRVLPVSFGGARIADSAKQLVQQHGAGKAPRLVEAPLGAGRLLWSPLPLEQNLRTETLKQVYAYALAKAGAEQELEWLAGGELPGLYGRKLTFAQGQLFLFVSEYGLPAEVSVRNPVTGKVYGFTVESERTVMFATDRQGSITAVYRPQEVAVHITEYIQ